MFIYFNNISFTDENTKIKGKKINFRSVMDYNIISIDTVTWSPLTTIRYALTVTPLIYTRRVPPISSSLTLCHSASVSKLIQLSLKTPLSSHFFRSNVS